MKHRPTLLDIARKVGVSKSAVSLALRHSPKISQSTSSKIRRVAHQWGYYPDPLLASLSAYRMKSKAFRGTLGWIDNWPERDGFRKNPTYQNFFQGAFSRAQELGYKLESFWLREKGMTSRRASDILRARGITGLILGPQSRSHARLDLLWEYFSVVAIGHTLAKPRFHIVVNHQFHSMRLAVRKVRSLGHRKIGFASPRESLEKTDRNHLAAFKLETDRLASPDQIPPFTQSIKGDFNPLNFSKWLHKYRPSVIITNETPIRSWLHELRFGVPEDMGYVELSIRDRQISGVDQRPDLIGKTAVDFIFGLLQKGERGIPETPWLVALEGRWNPGKTVRRMTR